MPSFLDNLPITYIAGGPEGGAGGVGGVGGVGGMNGPPSLGP